MSVSTISVAKSFVLILIVSLTLCCFRLTTIGAEPTDPEKIAIPKAEKTKPTEPTEPTELFDGKTLKGWDVITCEALVKDGAILLKSGNGLVQTKKCYTDFILEYEWKALKDDRWDSGLYFRYKKVPKGRPWPNRYQVNLRKGMEGDIDRFKEGKSRVPSKPGEWNRYVLTVKGTTASLEINGKKACKIDGLEEPSGFIALQAEVPGGGQFLFRKIRITELDAEK